MLRYQINQLLCFYDVCMYVVHGHCKLNMYGDHQHCTVVGRSVTRQSSVHIVAGATANCDDCLLYIHGRSEQVHNMTTHKYCEICNQQVLQACCFLASPARNIYIK